MSRTAFVVIVSLLSACARDNAKESTDTTSSPSSSQTNRCAPNGATVTTGGVGVVQIGTPVPSIRAQCTVRDTSITLEGMKERAHVVEVGGGSVIALSTGTTDTSVTRVIIEDGRYLTEGGIGVGKTVGALRKAHGSLCQVSAEGKTAYLASGVPGISFGTDSAAAQPDSTQITKLWVVGNPPRCAPR
jgi:hypothetical protein